MGWELTVVENAGEIPAEKVTDAIAVPAEPLLIDIKSQLMIEKPKTRSEEHTSELQSH